MFVFRSTYNKLVTEYNDLLVENHVLRHALEKASKNDQRDAKGKFTKAPVKPKKCKVKHD